jgi:hypothetical protein
LYKQPGFRPEDISEMTYSTLEKHFKDRFGDYVAVKTVDLQRGEYMMYMMSTCVVQHVHKKYTCCT